MGLKSMSLLANATVSASGGTALAFAPNSASIANGLQLMVPSDVDYQTRRMVTAKCKLPSLNTKTGAYGKDRKSLCLALPIVLTDGTVVFSTIRIEREVHPSQSAASVLEMNNLGAQMLIDADTAGFWATGDMS